MYKPLVFAVLLIGLVTAKPGPAMADMIPGVKAQIGTTVSEMFNGPVILELNDATRSALVLTDYGLLRAGSAFAANNRLQQGSGGVRATSQWSDILLITTPDVAIGTPINFAFSFLLHGHMEAFEENNTRARASVDLDTDLRRGFGGTDARFALEIIPTPESTGGGFVETDILTIVEGNYAVANGLPFDLIATLEAFASGEFFGPPASVRAQSAFAQSAVWGGGSVLVGGNPVSSFTMTSASGFDYSKAYDVTGVPEPSSLVLVGLGALGLIAFRWRARRAMGVGRA